VDHLSRSFSFVDVGGVIGRDGDVKDQRDPIDEALINLRNFRVDLRWVDELPWAERPTTKYEEDDVNPDKYERSEDKDGEANGHYFQD